MKLIYNSIWTKFVEFSNHVIYYEFILLCVDFVVLLSFVIAIEQLGEAM